MGKSGKLFGVRAANTGDRESDADAACDFFAYLSVFMCCFAIPIFVGGLCMLTLFSGPVRSAGIALVALSCALLVIGIIMLILLTLGCCNTSRWKRKSQQPVSFASLSAQEPRVIAPITVVTTGETSSGQPINQFLPPHQTYVQPPQAIYDLPPPPSQQHPLGQQPYNYA